MDQDNEDSSPLSGGSPPPTMAPPPLPIEYRTATAPPLPPRDDKSGLENPRDVQNLKDILHYATRMTAENPFATQEKRDEENMKFLSNALSSMSVNVHEELNNAINILLDTHKMEVDFNYALDILGEFVDNIDFANDFQKIGGFKVFPPCLTSKYLSVRSRTAELIATILQNNPNCQEKFMERASYTRLLMHLAQEDPDSTVRIKSLYALSCLVRHNVDVFWMFIEIGGDSLILYVLKSHSQKELIKVMFIILTTSAMDIAIAELYINIGVVEILCSIVMDIQQRVDPVHHDLFITVLRQFLDVSPNRVKNICANFDELTTFLPSLKSSYPADDEEYQDAKDQIDALMLILQP